MAKIPQEALFTACEAINDIHPQNGDDTENTNNAENNRDEDKTEHFTVLLSGVKSLCWFPIISAVVTSYDRQERLFVSLVSGLLAKNVINAFFVSIEECLLIIRSDYDVTTHIADNLVIEIILSHF